MTAEPYMKGGYETCWHGRIRMRADAKKIRIGLYHGPIYCIPKMSVGRESSLVCNGLQQIIYEIGDEGSVCLSSLPLAEVNLV